MRIHLCLSENVQFMSKDLASKPGSEFDSHIDNKMMKLNISKSPELVWCSEKAKQSVTEFFSNTKLFLANLTLV